jgi:hypothetical protein
VADPVPAKHLLHSCSCLGFLQDPDDLFLGEPTPSHDFSRRLRNQRIAGSTLRGHVSSGGARSPAGSTDGNVARPIPTRGPIADDLILPGCRLVYFLVILGVLSMLPAATKMPHALCVGYSTLSIASAR